MSKFILGMPMEDILNLQVTGRMDSIYEALDKFVKEEDAWLISPACIGYLTEIEGDGKMIEWEIRPTEDGKFVAERGE